MNEEASWDDICVNPHESFLELGRREGKEAGLKAGFNDGRSLGQHKALEFGIELGFIRGFVLVAHRDILPSIEIARAEKIAKSLHALQQAIDEFPGPDEMFQHVHDPNNTETMLDDELQSDSETQTRNALDVVGKMQRIRAKFKLVTVQLRIPHFSLKQVMEEAGQNPSNVGSVSNASAQNEVSETNMAAIEGGSSDW
jgi:hypothetical protein|uniref:Essential protein Yae1 N-terminal domain-containing protein n=1 Tax=Attheya septentrionalis TaxID=420275 RepID=A0A7S2XML9_9STRA|mmetsp:Transcript_22294/g.40214  ORF Transcript_22294/g.40214 Transcript_22294/m.40214 type:complete len:198 (+) Transcript_22294:178-771(+)|eukprot:CAMPEP_0198291708 /NCGR_PEP_ID=MMETSP1449-20131203/9153_1 /TAXON_ID=420275 /ORGANISM="Attheya septentrionalis, Strain CCMP2084" /LENGTH=197 /DNA_ID=CAMNT_0043990385 /DNA_START=135 /DNA_END=725 /DNA_ORIENTATION=+